MKVFFKLLLAGLFLMALGFVTEPQIASVDDDVGTYISQDIKVNNITTFEKNEIPISKDYTEVGISPGLSTEKSLDQHELVWYKEQMDLYVIINNSNAIAYNEGKFRYDKTTSNCKAQNNETNKADITLIESWEVFGLVPEPNQQG